MRVLLRDHYAIPRAGTALDALSSEPRLPSAPGVYLLGPRPGLPGSLPSCGPADVEDFCAVVVTIRASLSLKALSPANAELTLQILAPFGWICAADKMIRRS